MRGLVRDPCPSPRVFVLPFVLLNIICCLRLVLLLLLLLTSFFSHLIWRLKTEVVNAGTLDFRGSLEGPPGGREPRLQGCIALEERKTTPNKTTLREECVPILEECCINLQIYALLCPLQAQAAFLPKGSLTRGSLPHCRVYFYLYPGRR